MTEQDTDVFAQGGPFDRDDPRSLISIMPREARATLDNMPTTLLLMEETELARVVKPTPLLNHIRSAFWMEYDLAQRTLTRMSLKGVVAHMGNQSPSIHVREAFASGRKLAWILHPPMHYDSLLDESLTQGLRRIREILTVPLYDADGMLDHKAAELILKATAFLDIRKNGMPTQKIDSTMKSLQVNVTQKDAKALAGTMNPEELDLKIQQLEAEIDG